MGWPGRAAETGDILQLAARHVGQR